MKYFINEWVNNDDGNCGGDVEVLEFDSLEELKDYLFKIGELVAGNEKVIRGELVEDVILHEIDRQNMVRRQNVREEVAKRKEEARAEKLRAAKPSKLA